MHCVPTDSEALNVYRALVTPPVPLTSSDISTRLHFALRDPEAIRCISRLHFALMNYSKLSGHPMPWEMFERIYYSAWLDFPDQHLPACLDPGLGRPRPTGAKECSIREVDAVCLDPGLGHPRPTGTKECSTREVDARLERYLTLRRIQ